MVQPVLFAVALLPVIALGTVACGAGASVMSGNANPVPATNPSTVTSSGTSGSRGADSPKAAVIALVTDILEKRYTEACMLNMPPAGTDIATECQKPEVTAVLQHLHDAWAKPGITLPPTSQVNVTTVATSGRAASVQDTAITVDGHTLHSLMLIGATGDTGSFGMSLSLKEQNARWYIGDMNMNVGGTPPTS